MIVGYFDIAFAALSANSLPLMPLWLGTQNMLSISGVFIKLSRICTIVGFVLYIYIFDRFYSR